jgi:kynureninase
VHERHATNTKLPRFAGWFGNDPNTRFRLHLEPEFVPVASADGWQISNPPIFSMAPLRASLSIFHEAGGMEPLREKSTKLTGYLEFLIEQIGSKKFSLITPSDPSARGAQLSIQAKEHPKRLHEELIAAGVKCDFREPNVIRVAPTPLYNTFHEVWRFAQILAAHK